MSVLNRKELADSPLADLHQIAAELGVEGYRAMRKDDLIGAILGESGGSDEPADGESASAESTVAVAEEDGPAEPESAVAVADEGDEEEEDTSEGTSEDTSEGTSE